MGEYFRIDKSFIQLFIPLAAVLIWLGGATYQLSHLSKQVDELLCQQGQITILVEKVSVLEGSMKELREKVDVLRFNEIKGSSDIEILRETKGEEVAVYGKG